MAQPPQPIGSRRTRRSIAIGIGIALLLVGSIAIQIMRITADEGQERHRFAKEFTEHGIPVDTCVIDIHPYHIAAQTTALRAQDNHLVSLVSKHLHDQLRAGQLARIDLTDSDSIPARVISVNSTRDIDTGLYRVVIVSNTSSELPKAPFYHIRIFTRTIPDALIIPSDAISTNSHSAIVWIVQDGRAKSKTITLAAEDSLYALVTSGLAESDVLVTNGHTFLRDDALIRIRRTIPCFSERTDL